jgi:hypothetical protein
MNPKINIMDDKLDFNPSNMVTPKISSKSIVYIQWVFIGQINPTQVIYNDTKKYIKKHIKNQMVNISHV